MEPLDPLGSLILALSVAILFVLVLGLPLVRGINTKKNLMRHGILATVGLTLQTIIILVTMLPVLPELSGEILTLPPVFALTIWLHIVAGSVALVSGFVYTGLWLAFSTSQMRCIRAKKFMLPTLLFWISALVSGALIHLLQMF